MFLNNKYYTIYNRIVERAKGRTLIGYIEKHHILPKSLGGSNDSVNLVRLTAREHFIAHLCLVRCTTGAAHKKMCYAAWQIANRISGKANSRIYEALRVTASEGMSERRRNGTCQPKTYTRSAEVRKRISDTLKAKRVVPPSRKGTTVVFTEQHRENLSKGLTGLTRSEASRKKQSQTRMGLRWRIENGKRVFYRELPI